MLIVYRAPNLSNLVTMFAGLIVLAFWLAGLVLVSGAGGPASSTVQMIRIESPIEPMED